MEKGSSFQFDTCMSPTKLNDPQYHVYIEAIIVTYPVLYLT